jgi:hypothetical protein
MVSFMASCGGDAWLANGMCLAVHSRIFGHGAHSVSCFFCGDTAASRRVSASTGHDHGRTRTVGFRQSASRGKSDPQSAVLAVDDGTIGIRLIELIQQAPPSRTSATARWKVVAEGAGLRHGSRVCERVFGHDRAAKIEKHLERRSLAGPVDAGLNGRPPRGDADRGDAAAPSRGGSPAMARTSGSPIASTSVRSKRS